MNCRWTRSGNQWTAERGRLLLDVQRRGQLFWWGVHVTSRPGGGGLLADGFTSTAHRARQRAERRARRW